MGARPLASLSSGLLARPGHAKPAMRPQVFATPVAADVAMDDLGWNDMGNTSPTAAPVPPVLIERAELARVVAPKVVAPKAVADPARHRAAFTVRLDPDRHLRLRLASAVAGRSSQQLVVAAIDAFINSQPQIETLAQQIPVSGEKER